MTMPVEQARNLISSLGSRGLQNLYAQATAKHILLEVQETFDNFPDFDSQLDNKVTHAAYSLLAAGCSLYESNVVEEGRETLERAASLLQNVHAQQTTLVRESNFHTLVSAMALYASGHYSRAFVVIKKVESVTLTARLISTFLKKDFTALSHLLFQTIITETPEFDDQISLSEWVITNSVAKALWLLIEFLYTGNRGYLDDVQEILDDASTIAISDAMSSNWWLLRLLKLMANNLDDSSLWTVLPPLFEGDKEKLESYIRLMAYAKQPVIELWSSQIEALPKALDATTSGAVINLRTSAGKTRVAELAILQTLSQNPSYKVLYLVPFRSLAFEVEKTLSDTFRWLKISVSQLYGGARVSSVDTELISNTSIIIATPEKAKALFRAAPEIFEDVKLIVIDEGHLIGESDRYVRNELFIDHLRIFAKSTGARILLLSAVLPNPKELAQWVAGDENAVASSHWKPSGERFGLLRWKKNHVRLEWRGEQPSFNPSFVESKKLGFGRRRNYFPNTKNEAVAATAAKLLSIGPVMIFSARANSVAGLAKAMLLALGENPPNHPWPENEWNVFKAVCSEELGHDSLEFSAAQKGIICHSNRLTPQVRLAIEHLMRRCTPKIVIATTTLGQGVNIGVSSVIVSTPFISQQHIDKRDFWNICGRAGRAFVDGEGKVLYAIDDTADRYKVKRDLSLAEYYFSSSSPHPVVSGMLIRVRQLLQIAKQVNIEFEVFIELVANNDFEVFGEDKAIFAYNVDLMDDGLLALHEELSDESESLDWIEAGFRNSLIAIQARSLNYGVSETEVISFLKARVRYALNRIPSEKMRQNIVASGLPLSLSLTASEDLDKLRELIDDFLKTDMSLLHLSTFVEGFEQWTLRNGSGIFDSLPSISELNSIRGGWLSGTSLSELTSLIPEAHKLCKDFYGYHLPWIMNAVAQQLDKQEEESRLNALSTVALLVELGVPNELAAKIFLAGVRSREASTELSSLELDFGNSLVEVKNKFLDPIFLLQARTFVSESTTNWLNLILGMEEVEKKEPLVFSDFELVEEPEAQNLYVRRVGEQLFLTTIDGKWKLEVDSSEKLPFERAADDPSYVFLKVGQYWSLVLRNPRDLQ